MLTVEFIGSVVQQSIKAVNDTQDRTAVTPRAAEFEGLQIYPVVTLPLTDGETEAFLRLSPLGMATAEWAEFSSGHSYCDLLSCLPNPATRVV